MSPEGMKRRTKAFAMRILKMGEVLPKSSTAGFLRNQIIRCGTSVAANYRAACRVRSKAEFIAKLGIVEEEADET
jgi:four helix bundle protein